MYPKGYVGSSSNAFEWAIKLTSNRHRTPTIGMAWPETDPSRRVEEHAFDSITSTQRVEISTAESEWNLRDRFSQAPKLRIVVTPNPNQGGVNPEPLGCKSRPNQPVRSRMEQENPSGSTYPVGPIPGRFQTPQWRNKKIVIASVFWQKDGFTADREGLF